MITSDTHKIAKAYQKLDANSTLKYSDYLAIACKEDKSLALSFIQKGKTVDLSENSNKALRKIQAIAPNDLSNIEIEIDWIDYEQFDDVEITVEYKNSYIYQRADHSSSEVNINLTKLEVQELIDGNYIQKFTKKNPLGGNVEIYKIIKKSNQQVEGCLWYSQKQEKQVNEINNLLAEIYGVNFDSNANDIYKILTEKYNKDGTNIGLRAMSAYNDNTVFVDTALFRMLSSLKRKIKKLNKGD